jgi:hypothetical protein
MGSSNSGRHGGKGTTRGRNTLDVRKWQRDRLLIPGYRFDTSWTRNGQPNGAISVVVNENGVHLIYRHGGDTGQDMNYPVLIDWTPCNYGGRRAWWKCPCCGRRVALLYSGKMFACRHCHRLDYESTRSSDESQAFARADKVRKRLGWVAGIAHPIGDKPKGMHHQTYWRWLATYNNLAMQAIGASSASLDKMMGRLHQINRAADKYEA